MGHKRKNPTPSPIRMLSIFHARKHGLALPEIAERTGHSISSIMRWTEKSGHEADFLELMLQNFPELTDKIGFDAHYPKGGKPPTVRESDDVEDEDGEESEESETTETGPLLTVVGDE